MGSCLFQNYMTPLRLVLSPADMAAIFINLEVRPPLSPAGAGCSLPFPPWDPGRPRPCWLPGWLVPWGDGEKGVGSQHLGLRGQEDEVSMSRLGLLSVV